MDSWLSSEKMSTIKRELKQIMVLALPAIVQSSSTMAMTATDQIMVGHLGRDALAAASVGNTWYNLLFYFQLGFGSALDTLASQAFGAGDSTALCSATITSLLAGIGSALPMIAGLLLTGPVAQFMFAQTPELAAQTAAFCVRLVPGVLPQILGLLLVKVLQAQNEMLAPAALGIAAFLVNIGMNFIFIRALGFLGAPIATTASRVLYLIGAVLVLAHSLHYQRRKNSLSNSLAASSSSSSRLALASADDVKENYSSALESKTVAPAESSVLQAAAIDTLTPCHTGDVHASQSEAQRAVSESAFLADASWEQAWQQSNSWKSFQTYLKLAIPGGFMVAMEAGSFDVTTMMAGTLGVAQVDAHVALLTVNTFAFVSLPFGIATAATIRVGNLLGSKRPQQAATSAWCAVACGSLSMMICALATVLLRHKIGLVFIKDQEVADLVAMIAPLGAFLMLFDGIMGTAQGALRGVGHQVKILCFNAVGFWGVGVSTGAVLTFVAHWGLRGIWIGLTMGVTATCMLNLWGLLAVNWQQSAEQTRSSETGTMQSDMLPGDSVHRKNELPQNADRQTSWLGAMWATFSDRVLGIPSRQEYSLVGDVHEMKVLVTDACETR